MAFVPGEFYLVRFAIAGPPLFHERLVICPHGDHNEILTPDNDRYEEPCVEAHAEVGGIRRLQGQGAPCLGVDPARIYRFNALPTDIEMAWLYRDAAVAFGVAVEWPYRL